MSDVSGTSASTPAGDRPFRLIVHIGAGKTGTTTIQQTLRQSTAQLDEARTLYLGLMLELGAPKIYPWQAWQKIEAFLKLDKAKAAAQMEEVLRKTIAKARKDGYRQAIWSNEVFLVRSRVILSVLQNLAADGIDVDVVAFVRRHDAWARSAYVQWALRHKTNAGPLENFAAYLKRRPIVFAKALGPWKAAFGPKLLLRNLDAVGDSLKELLAIAGLDVADFGLTRRNESASMETLALHAIYNSQFDKKVPITRWVAAMGGSPVPSDKTVETFLADLLPTPQELEGVKESCAEDREQLDAWLAEGGQPPIETKPLDHRPVVVDGGKMTAALTHIVMRQSERLLALEEKLASLTPVAEQNPPETTMPSPRPARAMPSSSHGEAPVFAISTGRSGSTLVQRILNCHKDLVVWGEHYGFLGGLAQSYAAMTSPDQKLFPRSAAANKGPDMLLPTLQDPAVAIEWVNPWSAAEYVDQLRSFISGYFGGRLAQGQRWGFKEIRYNSLPVLRMLHELYPAGRFVFIRRDIEEVTRSKIAAFVKETRWSTMAPHKQQEQVKKFITETEEHYKVYGDFMSRYPGLGIAVDFELLDANPKQVIGETLDHLGLDAARFDWSLADQVIGSVITKTKRDPEIMKLVRQVMASLKSTGT
ncbi:MAG: sulfotransferase [Alphaproteobacteria bacterium]|nr:sulfotransferase [Alphaproteobacteria bacterium]